MKIKFRGANRDREIIYENNHEIAFKRFDYLRKNFVISTGETIKGIGVNSNIYHYHEKILRGYNTRFVYLQYTERILDKEINKTVDIKIIPNRIYNSWKESEK